MKITDTLFKCLCLESFVTPQSPPPPQDEVRIDIKEVEEEKEEAAVELEDDEPPLGQTPRVRRHKPIIVVTDEEHILF